MTETPKDQHIINLLRTLRDLQGTSTSGTGQRDGEDRILHNPGGQWEKTGCDTLDGLLINLKLEWPIKWWHTTERYLRCDSRARTVTAKRTHSGRLIISQHPFGLHSQSIGEGIRLTDSWHSANEIRVVVETWSHQVRLPQAELGIRYLSNRFPFNNYKHRDLQPIAA